MINRYVIWGYDNGKQKGGLRDMIVSCADLENAVAIMFLLPKWDCMYITDMSDNGKIVSTRCGLESPTWITNV